MRYYRYLYRTRRLKRKTGSLQSWKKFQMDIYHSHTVM